MNLYVIRLVNQIKETYNLRSEFQPPIVKLINMIGWYNTPLFLVNIASKGNEKSVERKPKKRTEGKRDDFKALFTQIIQFKLWRLAFGLF